MNEAELEAKLGISFNDKKLLTQALTHPSFFSGKKEREFGHNARLEFFGDAVLNFIVAEHIYHNCPAMRESWLTTVRTQLIRATTLGAVGEELGLEQYLNHGDSEMKSEKGDSRAEKRSRLMAETLEALVGAFYVDSGLEATRALVSRVLLPRFEDATATALEMINPKSLLNRKARELLGVTPEYKVHQEKGKSRKTKKEQGFTAQVFFGDKKISESWANKAKWATKQAALLALQKQGWV